jgi:hypothetical protein
MAQTVSIQRGSTTITSGSVATLFTNGSGGLGTRVIINQIAVTGTNGASGTRSPGLSIIINGSGVGQTAVGLVRAYQSNQGTVAPMFPAQFGMSVNSQNSVLATGMPVFTSNTPDSMYYPQGISGGVAITTGCMPQTFWIGPSDGVQCLPFGFATPSGKSQVPSSVTIRYSFTLITES